MDLKSKVVAITGSGRGIGRELARTFAARGADIALMDVGLEDLEESKRLCLEHAVRVHSVQCNVTDEAQVKAALDSTVQVLGGLDVMVNNAGITKDALLIKVQDGTLVSKMTLEQWQAVISVNLTGVFLTGREAAEHMTKRGKGGVIINISSVSRSGNVGQTNYSAAKAGVAAMAVTWSKELARYGIRAAAIAPGFTRTDILSAMKPETLERALSPVPLKRLAEPSEMAHAAIFIAENDYFTGRVLEVDGGLRM